MTWVSAAGASAPVIAREGAADRSMVACCSAVVLISAPTSCMSMRRFARMCALCSSACIATRTMQARRGEKSGRHSHLAEMPSPHLSPHPRPTDAAASAISSGASTPASRAFSRALYAMSSRACLIIPPPFPYPLHPLFLYAYALAFSALWQPSQPPRKASIPARDGDTQTDSRSP